MSLVVAVHRGGKFMLKVSVVVAVYNPGSNIDELLLSLDRQSLPRDQFEVIFADDDSTDGSRDRLRGWADSRPNVQVLHNTPNSGWPGRPRNLAIDAAQGEYLFFVDNDDRLTPRSLEWMVDFADTNGSDVVVAKEVGDGRAVNRAAFRRNVPDAKLGTDPLLGDLTPHKLVRTSMVRDHDIRYPEGRVRLEDHYFITRCYFAADKISILADRPCYYWMRRKVNGKNESLKPYEPVVYFQAVERTLAVVEENTEPGPLRDQLYAHWYDKKMLNALRGKTLLSKRREHQESLVRELRRVSERFGLGVAQWPWLGAGARLRSHVLHNGTLEQIKALGRAEPFVTSTVDVEAVTWTDDDRLRITARGQLVGDGGRPIPVVRDGDSTRWDLSRVLPDLGLELPDVDLTDLLEQIDLATIVISRHTKVVDFLEGTSTPIPGEVFAARVESTLDIRRLLELNDFGAVLDLSSRVEAGGWASERRLLTGPRRPPEPRVINGWLVRPYLTENFGNLSVEIREPRAGEEHALVSGEAMSAPMSRLKEAHDEMNLRFYRFSGRVLDHARRRVEQRLRQG